MCYNRHINQRKTKMSNYTALIQAHFNSIVTNENGQQFSIGSLDEKVGAMKDGSKLEYLALINKNDQSETLLHPRVWTKLLTSNEADKWKLSVEKLETEQLDGNVKNNDVEDAAIVSETVNSSVIENPVVDVKPIESDNHEVVVVTPTPFNMFSQLMNTKVEQIGLTTVDDAAKKEVKISKKAIAVPIVQNGLKDNKKRKEIIEMLMSQANLSKHGAATYYQNIVSGQWA